MRGRTVGVDGCYLYLPKILGISVTGVAGGKFLRKDVFRFILPLYERGVDTVDYDYRSLFDVREFARKSPGIVI